LKMKNIFDISPIHLQRLLADWKEPAYRVNQIIAAVWTPGITNFSEVTSIPISLRTRLNSYFFIPAPIQPKKELISEDGTFKALFTFADQMKIESVAIPKDDRLTFCLSTQVGCAMGCRFCATAQLGFHRNLTPAEIIAQIRGLAFRLKRKPTNLVFMGMGEPLQNLEAVRTALDIITYPQAMNWSPHKSIISTCGWVPGIEAITQKPIKAKLALSLNAVDNQLRNHLMPVNRQYPLEKVLTAIRHYSMATGDSVSIEYMLISGINDRIQDATLLAHLLKKYRVKINLIPFNPIPGINFCPPSEATIAAFLRELRKSKILTTLRTSRGKTIGAACGQLSGKQMRKVA